MQDMTPEERFTRIENLLGTITENQARHDTEIEKNNAAIRDLIIVSRTLVESQLRSAAETDKLRDQLRASNDQLRVSIAELRDAQHVTDEKLHILIETVDRIIRNRNQ